MKYLVHLSCFIVLTALTQVGGIVYLFSFLFHPSIDMRVKNGVAKLFVKTSFFLLLYLLATCTVVPITAKVFGRVALPLNEANHLKPLNFITCLLNRHYVRPDLKKVVIEIADKMHRKHPGSEVRYLDGNFPFVNRFPLLPHLSHNDGEKLDLSFFYLDAKTKTQTNQSPSWIGYGISSESSKFELSQCKVCESNGYWQYGLLNKIIPQKSARDFLLDEARTKELVKLCAHEKEISKIFIEPELKAALGLSNEKKIRFQGCQSVRHDDHLHIQL